MGRTQVKMVPYDDIQSLLTTLRIHISSSIRQPRPSQVHANARLRLVVPDRRYIMPPFSLVGDRDTGGEHFGKMDWMPR